MTPIGDDLTEWTICPDATVNSDVELIISTYSVSKHRRKTKSAACRRCHAQKIRCLRGQPCEQCRVARKTTRCLYPRRTGEMKFRLRTLGKIAEKQLYKNRLTNAELRVETEILNGPLSSADGPGLAPSAMEEQRQEEEALNMDVNASQAHVGKPSSITFAMAFCRVVSESQREKISCRDCIPHDTLLSCSAADCSWPTPSQARLLVNVALKYLSYHVQIVCGNQITRDLEHVLYETESLDRRISGPLCTSKIWALFAIGELYTSRTVVREGDYPGLAYYTRAMRDVSVITQSPSIDAIELHLLLAFYSLAVNHPRAAYVLAGSAVRLSVVMCLHLNRRVAQPEYAAGEGEHGTRLWWAAYSLDRLCAAALGYPPSIHDDDIEVDLPSTDLAIPSGNSTDPSSLHTTTQLAHLLTKVTKMIHTRKSQRRSLYQKVKEVLGELHDFSNELPAHFQLRPTHESKPNLKILSLHLYLNQCTVTATRPMLLLVLENHVAAKRNQSGTGVEIPNWSSIISLSESCIMSARRSCRMLIECWTDGAFPIFDSFFTQHLFSAATVLAMSSVLNKPDSLSDREMVESAFHFLADLEGSGNLAAKELCLYTDAMQLSMRDFHSTKDSLHMLEIPSSLTQLENFDVGLHLADFSSETTMGVPDISLQELLAQLSPLDFTDGSANCI